MQHGLTQLEQVVEAEDEESGLVLDGVQAELGKPRAKKAKRAAGGFFRQSYSNERMDNKRMSQMIQEATQGSFPVDVQIPETGQAFQFSTLLINGQAPTISVRYYSNLLAWFLGVGLFAVVFLGGRRQQFTARAVKTLVLGVLIVVLVHAWWPLLGRLLNGAGLAALVLLGLALQKFFGKEPEDA